MLKTQIKTGQEITVWDGIIGIPAKIIDTWYIDGYVPSLIVRRSQDNRDLVRVQYSNGKKDYVHYRKISL